MKMPVGMDADLRANAQQAKHEHNAFDGFHFAVSGVRRAEAAVTAPGEGTSARTATATSND
jgi:hypothetical protein